jgi:DNA polymerase III epsilon subunit-like protein
MRWMEQPIVMVDTETTGLLWTTHRIIEVAATAFRLTSDPLKPEFLGNFETLVHPGSEALQHPDTPEALAVNHIRVEDLQGAPVFSQVTPRLQQFLEGIGSMGSGKGLSISAFNAEFDHRMVAAEWLRTGLSLPTWLECSESTNSGWLDPLIWCRDANKYAKGGHSLAKQRERLGIASEGPAHRALTDVLDAAKVVNWLVNTGHPALREAFRGNHAFAERKTLIAYQDILAAGQQHDLLKWLFEKHGG